MGFHFLHWHVQDTVVILEEGNLPHTQYTRYYMLVTWRVLNGRHLYTAQCANGVERKRRRLAEEELRESS